MSTMSGDTELTTQEAADLLNFSRPFLLNLLEKNKIPFRKVGNRRKILLEDLIKFKSSMYSAREQALDFLVEDAQKHNMGY